MIVMARKGYGRLHNQGKGNFVRGQGGVHCQDSQNHGRKGGSTSSLYHKIDQALPIFCMYVEKYGKAWERGYLEILNRVLSHLRKGISKVSSTSQPGIVSQNKLVK